MPYWWFNFDLFQSIQNKLLNKNTKLLQNIENHKEPQKSIPEKHSLESTVGFYYLLNKVVVVVV